MEPEGWACWEAPQEPTQTWTSGWGGLWADAWIKTRKCSLITVNVPRRTAANRLQAQAKWIETSSVTRTHSRAKTFALNSCVPLRRPYYPPHCRGRSREEQRQQMNGPFLLQHKESRRGGQKTHGNWCFVELVMLLWWWPTPPPRMFGILNMLSSLFFCFFLSALFTIL